MCMKCTALYVFRSGEMAPKGHIASKPPSAVESIFVPTWDLKFMCII